MNELTDTEKKLAIIWKLVLSLSEEEWQNLARQSDSVVLLSNFCKKIKPPVLSDPKTLEEQKVFIKGYVCSNLAGHVDSDFGIWSNGIADCRTLGEQAVFIDCCLTVASKDDRPQKMQYDPKVLQASLAEMPLPSIFWFDEPDSKT